MAPKAATSPASNAATEVTTPVTTPAPKSKEAPGITKRTNAYFVDPRTVMRREGWNPRFDFGEIEELAASIVTNGVLTPIRVKRLATPVVKDGQTGAVFNFELIDGDRRLTAMELILGKNADAFPDGIPAMIVNKDQEDLTSLIQMFEANNYKQFLPMEEALAYKRMRDAGMTVKAICSAVGRKQPHVSSMLALLEADVSIQEAVHNGTLGKTDAKNIAVVAKGDKAKQKELMEAAKTAGKAKGARQTVRRAIETANAQKAAKKGKTLKIRALSDSELSTIGQSMSKHLLKLLEEMELPADTDLVGIFKADPMLTIAYTTGALDALKVAAGGTNLLKL